jgi:hypothetical protein
MPAGGPGGRRPRRRPGPPAGTAGAASSGRPGPGPRTAHRRVGAGSARPQVASAARGPRPPGRPRSVRAAGRGPRTIARPRSRQIAGHGRQLDDRQPACAVSASRNGAMSATLLRPRGSHDVGPGARAATRANDPRGSPRSRRRAADRSSRQHVGALVDADEALPGGQAPGGPPGASSAIRRVEHRSNGDGADRDLAVGESRPAHVHGVSGAWRIRRGSPRASCSTYLVAADRVHRAVMPGDDALRHRLGGARRRKPDVPPSSTAPRAGRGGSTTSGRPASRAR